MWAVLIFVVLFPLFGALFWMLAIRIMPPSIADVFLWIAYLYIVLTPIALILGVVEYLTRRWPSGLLCSVLLAFVLVPFNMGAVTLFAMFDGQRVDISPLLIFGLVGAGSTFVSGVVGRSVQAVVVRTGS